MGKNWRQEFWSNDELSKRQIVEPLDFLTTDSNFVQTLFSCKIFANLVDS